MMKREAFAVADIYVPVNRRAMLVQKRVDKSHPRQHGQQTPILVRADGARFVLSKGMYTWLEAAKALGEKTSSASAWESASIKRPFSSSGG